MSNDEPLPPANNPGPIQRALAHQIMLNGATPKPVVSPPPEIPQQHQPPKEQ